METAIDVRNLPEDEVKLVQELVEFLRQRVKTKRTKRGKKRAGQVTFSAHRSDVIGSLTRREIYEEV